MLSLLRRLYTKPLLTNPLQQNYGTTTTAMPAPEKDTSRYPKRKRAQVDYDVEKSFADFSDDEDHGGYVSEELGNDWAVSDTALPPSGAANSPKADDLIAVFKVEVDSEYEDATFGSRKKTKKVWCPLLIGCHPPPPTLLTFVTAQGRDQAQDQTSAQAQACAQVDAVPTDVSLSPVLLKPLSSARPCWLALDMQRGPHPDPY
jgi:hypothetical protein